VAILVAFGLLGLPSRLVAQPLVLLSAEYGAPMRASAGFGVLTPFGSANPSRATSQTRSGLVIAGSLGEGGEQLAAGLGGLVRDRSYLRIYGFDIRGTLTRTRGSPRGATPEATYGGIEAGLTLSLLRVSAGYAHRVTGPPGPKGDRFTWTVGAQLPLGW
jgi:hypothetical protein